MYDVALEGTTDDTSRKEAVFTMESTGAVPAYAWKVWGEPLEHSFSVAVAAELEMATFEFIQSETSALVSACFVWGCTCISQWLSYWPAAARSKASVCVRSLAGIFWFESRRGHGCLSVVSVVCCQVEVSATSWSVVQRSPTDCGVSEVWSWSLDNEEALAH
jgi:hypothetical protein